MTALTIARREMPLDDLVVRVYHLELKECRDEAEFKDAIQLVLRKTWMRSWTRLAAIGLPAGEL
jgi:hypothetical protein